MIRRRFPIPPWQSPARRSSRKRRDYPLRPPDRIEYFLFRLVGAAILSMPWRFAVDLSRLLSRILFQIDGKHRRLAMKNLSTAFPDWTERRLHLTARRTYEHFGRVVLELFWAPRFVRASTLHRHAVFVGYDIMDAALRRGRGVVGAVPHLGSWEFLGYASALRGTPLTSIARPLDNRWINDYLIGVRTWTGQEIIYKQNALRRMIGCLRENRVIGVPSDQNVRHNGIFAPFFGRSAATVRSTALLVVKYGASLVVANPCREETPYGFRYILEVSPAVDLSHFPRDGNELQHVTEYFTRKIEEFVRKHPEQYLWMHRRWKTRPPEERPDEEEARMAAEKAGTK